MLMRHLLSQNNQSASSSTDIAQAIDFDGTYDYLSRTSDLTGNADGKTFTFSAWVWRTGLDATTLLYALGNVGVSIYVDFSVNNLGAIGFSAYSSTGTLVLNMYTSNGVVPKDIFSHILVSIDLSSVSNRRVYVNDVVVSTTYSTYSNTNIDWSRPNHYIHADLNPTSAPACRLSNIFLDYTYRDLSVEANRRLFITADRKPAANQAALNPIIYLPMDDPTTAHINQGTGGNFTLNGTVARSGIGANQFNAPYSDLDGSADYLSSTSITGIADSKTFTFACVIKKKVTTASYFFYVSNRFTIGIENQKLIVYSKDATNTFNYRIDSQGTIADNRNNLLIISVNLSDTNKRHLIVNGVEINPTYTAYTDSYTDFNYDTVYRIGDSGAAMCLGNVFFDTRYIDLSVPANLAKFCTGTGIDCKPISLGANGELPFGTPPLIYLPMYANNAGKNYGTGGDFTANSSPYTGARSMNEYWGNKADFDGSTGYLSRTSALIGVSDGKTFSCSFWYNTDVSGANKNLFGIENTSDNTAKFRIGLTTTPQITIEAGAALEGIATTTIYATNPYFVQICIDMTNTSKRFIYINGVQATVSWNKYNNSDIQFSLQRQLFGKSTEWNWYYNGKLSEFYFTTDYIDFSQESNRLKFRDAFGSPVNLLPQIQAGTLPNPAIYMRFDPNNLGKNDGTGGDFVKNGTILDGGQL